VIDDDLDVMSVVVDPPEADAPLIVDPDAVLTRATASQPFESIARGHVQVVERDGSVELSELPQRHPLNVGARFTDRLALEQTGGVPISETPNHGT
jgi:hypothetical protein